PGRHFYAALGLDGFHDEGGRRGNTTGAVLILLAQAFDGMHSATQIAARAQGNAAEGCVLNVLERNAGGISKIAVCGTGQRAEGHAVKAVMKGNYLTASRHLARELERRFNRIA